MASRKYSKLVMYNNLITIFFHDTSLFVIFLSELEKKLFHLAYTIIFIFKVYCLNEISQLYKILHEQQDLGNLSYTKALLLDNLNNFYNLYQLENSQYRNNML